jgi:glycosyltransferase involved in cell wall biosynthesis
MGNPLVSVIVPVFNVEDYLERCINSILKQTLVDFELILINDGSTDRSAAICDDFANVNDRIKVIHKKNGGLSDARNAGLDIAKGSFITFVDSDDWIEHDMLDHLYNLLLNTNANISQCSYAKVDSYNEKIKEKNNKISVFTITDTPSILERFFNNKDVSSIVCDKMFSSTLFSDLRFPVNQNLEDHYLLSDIFVRTKSIVISNDIKYYYYQRENSIMNLAKNLKHMQSSFLAYKNRIKVSREIENKFLLSTAVKGFASDFFQYYRLIFYYVDTQNKNQMYLELKREHRKLKVSIWKNKLITLKFKVMLELCYLNPSLISTFVKR